MCNRCRDNKPCFKDYCSTEFQSFLGMTEGSETRYVCQNCKKVYQKINGWGRAEMIYFISFISAEIIRYCLPVFGWMDRGGSHFHFGNSFWERAGSYSLKLLCSMFLFVLSYLVWWFFIKSLNWLRFVFIIKSEEQTAGNTDD